MAVNQQHVEDVYEFAEILGTGHFGTVKKCCAKKTGETFAAKFIKVRKSRTSRWGLEREQIDREISILSDIQHPSIAALHDVFESRTEMVLILELVLGGELFDYVAAKDSLNEEEAMNFIQQLLEALRYLHSKNITHLDLKPENILLRDREVPHPEIKLIDFGLAQRMEAGMEFRRMCGTPQYIAPEIINYDPLGCPADMWSVGVITYILLSGLSPFQGDTERETLSNIVEVSYELDDSSFAHASEMAKDFIRKLLLKDPADRLSAEDSLNHPWFKPKNTRQALVRSRSAINMEKFKVFNARRRWKVSFRIVSACNRFQLVKGSRRQIHRNVEDVFRQCESDHEDSERTPAVLFRRRRSSSS